MFEKVVEIYRTVGRPPLRDDGAFVYDGPNEAKLSLLVKEMEGTSQYGEFLYLRQTSERLNFEFAPVSSGEFGFFHSFEDYVRLTSTLGTGSNLTNFYILNENWSTTDHAENERFNTLTKICKLIVDLANVADSSHVEKNCVSLVFSIPGTPNKPAKTTVVKSYLNQEILKLELQRTNLIGSLANSSLRGRVHLEERRAIFNGAICEILESAPDDTSMKFMHILSNWSTVLDIYWKNFQVYIHSFSFEKVRKEFAQAELDYSTKISSAFSDITGKLLAIPVSLIALITLNNSTSQIESFVTLIGLCIASIILFGTLLNQHLSIERLNNSLEISFENLSKNIDTYPKNLQRLISKSKTHLDKQKKLISFTLTVFLVLSVTPAIGGITVLYSKNKLVVDNWFKVHIDKSRQTRLIR